MYDEDKKKHVIMF